MKRIEGFNGLAWMVARQRFVEKLINADRTEIPGIVAEFFKEHVHRIGMSTALSNTEKNDLGLKHYIDVKEWRRKDVFRNIGLYLLKNEIFQHDWRATEWGEVDNYFILAFGVKNLKQGELDI